MTFPNFSNLPKKIRYQIWEYAIQDHVNTIKSCIETSTSLCDDTDINRIFDHPLSHIIFFRAIPMPELKDGDQRKQFVLRHRAVRECKATRSVTLTAPGHENQRKKVPSWTEGHATVFRGGGTKFWRINQEAVKIWNRYIKQNLSPIHGLLPLSIQIGAHKVKLPINEGHDLVCIRPDMSKKWSYDTSFADIMEFLSPPTVDAARHLAFEYEPDLHGRSFDAKIARAPPRWDTWIEFFGGKMLHAFCRSRGALLSGNEVSGRWLQEECTFYLVNNSETTVFYKDKTTYMDKTFYTDPARHVCFLAKGKVYQVQGEDQPPLDRIRKAALEEEFGPASEWRKKGIKPRLACRLLMLWPTREMAPPRQKRGNPIRSMFDIQRRWFDHPEKLVSMFPGDM
ncbi:hypothetical protein PG993_004412 [Apiospora rasikravindrae]|uniref:2EXR domain-containing protein n=1 Tax=Apiospora rasikravindrae TaxID=990691 RepID=A0ABR1TFF1_9PEZI